MREKETHESWMDGTAVSDIFNERLRTENLCFPSSINENPDESETHDNLYQIQPSAVHLSDTLF